MKKLKAIIIGCGQRGITYSNIMKNSSDKFEVVAIAEPIPERRNYVKEQWEIPEEMCFEDYNPLFKLGKIADFVIIANMDRDHFAATMKAIDLKYDILLEKPIAPTEEECRKLVDSANKNNVRVVICTVLRYTNMFKTLKKVIESGRIGKLVSINHEECVGNLHFSHSFIRGNWGNTERSSSMLLQKSCHDLDILYWLIGKKCKSIQSFGSLSYFKEENAPENAPQYCIEGCPHSEKCPYDAVKVYYDDKKNAWFRTTATMKPKPTDDDVLYTIKNSQYGKCVYKCDNDVVDRQTVNMIFADDILVNFTMNPFNKGGRFIHIMGTKGEIRTALHNDTPIEIYDFETKNKETVEMVGSDGINGGHGGGDTGLINDIYYYFNNKYEGFSVPTINDSLYSHLLVFAAEKSRLTNKIIDVSDL